MAKRAFGVEGKFLNAMLITAFTDPREKEKKIEAKFPYEVAVMNYDAAADMEDSPEEYTQSQIDAAWSMAASDYWTALVMGHERAPYGLYKCFVQGVGVKENTALANLMFGVALKFNDPDCQKGMRGPNQLNKMTTEINKLYNLILDTKAKYPDGKIIIHKVIDEQMTIFNILTKELTGKNFNDCYISTDVKASSSNNVVVSDEMKSDHYHQLEPLGQTKDEGENDGCSCVLM